MARIAVISDIHGNLIALDRVIADVRSRRVDRMVCLGDIVGYGPDPKECLDIVRQYCDGIVAGNHERGVTEPDLESFSKPVLASLPKQFESKWGKGTWDALAAL